ncbi:MAG TPA: non-ribosomal peptide synthetase [Longimicrobium sp.]|jgi:acyl carrier protein|uniref:non-ribosomal peptide synthetase n=1 Tax=Longimicrobium sp. TaxID=2029185 RepID=UPI002ED7E505
MTTPLALREVITAGEQLVATPQIAALIEGTPGCRLHNHYGPTETHVATAHALSARSAEWGLLPPIGRPVPNMRVYVLDRTLRPVPIGVAGELYIGGAQVARGYLGRPRLTAERFIPSPFGPEPGARIYATGDRARWRGDGELEYLGRADQQLKIRGYRVEPGEIETVLRQREDVRDCAVVAREDVPGDRRLVAYVAGQAPADELRDHLRRGLPEHMVPSAFVFLDRLPLTPSGKLDRRALPAPELARVEDLYVAPRTPVEAQMAEIWAEVLRVERVGRDHGFFQLGGHSLLLLKLQARIRERMGVQVPVVDLFRFPTVATLSEHLDAGRAAPAPRRGSERAARRRALALRTAGRGTDDRTNREDDDR